MINWQEESIQGGVRALCTDNTDTFVLSSLAASEPASTDSKGACTEACKASPVGQDIARHNSEQNSKSRSSAFNLSHNAYASDSRVGESWKPLNLTAKDILELDIAANFMGKTAGNTKLPMTAGTGNSEGTILPFQGPFGVPVNLSQYDTIREIMRRSRLPSTSLNRPRLPASRRLAHPLAPEGNQSGLGGGEGSRCDNSSAKALIKRGDHGGSALLVPKRPASALEARCA